ncbi:MAG: NAD(P)/FAD-dependent oxidoreductase [Planctomycetota bacterium]
MENIVIAGAGIVGANIAYQLAARGTKGVVLADYGTVACGSTGKAIGGVRQQFSTAEEVKLTQISIQFFESLGSEFFQQYGYLFFATTERGLAELNSRQRKQSALGVPVENVSPAQIAALAAGININDIRGGVYCSKDGLADPPAVAREIVKRAAAMGVEVRERVDPLAIEANTYVIASGCYSVGMAARFDIILPIRPLVRQLIETEPILQLPERLPMLIEVESGFHFRRKRDRLIVAMNESQPRWQWEQTVDTTVIPDRMRRLRERFAPAIDTNVSRAWAGLYDMTPDAQPILGKVSGNVFVACGFSGHGFMQSPAVGRAIAEEILDGASTIDISHFRLDRFERGVVFHDDVVL